MTQEQITQTVEAIKTLNINFNDATTQKIADTIIPIMKMYIIQQYVEMFLWFIGTMIFFFLVYKLIKMDYKNKEEERKDY
jgi:flagellar biosynthesis/type III secretory pathway M-ring protein FliF/YscJ